MPRKHVADPVDIAVGARIRLTRRSRGLSQQALAEACGVTFQQIQKYERGANRVSASMIWRVAKVLKVTVAELFGEVSPTASEVIDENAALLAEPGARRLLSAYGRLPRGAPRATLVEFVDKIAA